MTFRARMESFLPPLLPLLLSIAVVETVVRMAWVPSYLIPTPSDVFHSLLDDRLELALAAWETLSSALAGLVPSFAVGTLFSVALSSSDLARRGFYPYAVFFQTVPIISIAPLLVIWFGFGRPTVVASAAIVLVFPIIASTLLGLKSTEPALVDLFKLYSATGRQTLWMLKIPFALPQIFSGLRIASGLAVAFGFWIESRNQPSDQNGTSRCIALSPVSSLPLFTNAPVQVTAFILRKLQ